MNRRIFVDMDGTLAKWNNVPSTDILYEADYYYNLEPNKNLLDGIKNLIKEGENVYILSSFLSDSKYALNDKNKWLDKYLKELPADKRIFVKYGDQKSKYIPDKIDSNDFLIDDYTKNLLDWKASGGTGIKFLNGINHTRKTWEGFMLKDDTYISYNLKSIFDNIISINNSINNDIIDRDIADDFC